VRRGRVDGKDVGARAVSSSARSARRRQLVIPREAEKSVDVEERREGEEEQGLRKSKESSLREGNWSKAKRGRRW
jgi:hypothetical protein